MVELPPPGNLNGDEEMAEASPTTTPEPFTPANDAAMTMQAQHTLANDSPTDVNNNAVLARSQALTIDLAGKAFMNAQDRRTIFADKDVKPT